MALQRTFVLRNADAVRAMYAFLHSNWQAAADSGKPLATEVREHKAKHSNQANRLYHRRLQQIAQDAWVDAKQFSPSAWHAFFAGKFVGLEVGPDGRETPLSTADLDSEEFAIFLTRVEAYAATELGLELM